MSLKFFTGYRILSWRLFCFTMSDISVPSSFCCFLEVSVMLTVAFRRKFVLFSSEFYKISSCSLIFSRFIVMCLGVFLLIFSMWGSQCFLNLWLDVLVCLGKFLSIIFSNMASTPSKTPVTHVRPSHHLTYVSYTLSCISYHFFFCLLNWKFSTDPSSSSLICSSTVPNMLLNPSIEASVIDFSILKFLFDYIVSNSPQKSQCCCSILEHINHSHFKAHDG